MCIFDVFDITNYIEITQSVMPKLVYLLTMQEAHKEYNSLTDQLWAKLEQLDSDEYGAVGIPAFNAEACELADLLARVSQLWVQEISVNMQGNSLNQPVGFTVFNYFSYLWSFRSISSDTFLRFIPHLEVWLADVVKKIQFYFKATPIVKYLCLRW